MNTKRLPDAELDVMLAVWCDNDVKSASEILSIMSGKREWGLATLSTVLSRLVKKGYLKCYKKGRNNFYKAIISEEKYRNSESRSLLEKLYGNSISSLVSSLFENETIDEKDLEELQASLASIRKGDGTK